MKLKQPDIKGFNPLDKINEKSKPTPMMQQYLEVKGRHKEYLLFYRMGDFYELFFEDAKIASSELGIALTKRGKINNEDIPMCGVPAHSAQTYLSRLINYGYKIAIAEQLESEKEPSKIKKNQKLFTRDVVKILTPGTILDDSLLNSKSNNHLMSISQIKGQISISWTDMSVGVIKLQKIEGSNLANDLYECISKIEPEEIIVSDQFNSFKILDIKLNKFEKKISNVSSDFFNPENNKIKIKNFFKDFVSDPLNNLTTSDKSALGALINYLELTQKKNIPLINDFKLISKEDSMQIDDFSVKSLELFEKNDGQLIGSLLSVIDNTRSAAGGRLLRDFLKSPLVNIKEISRRHDLVNEFKNNSLNMNRIIDLLSTQPDVERALSRISAKTNNPRDLVLLKNFIDISDEIFLEIKNLNKKKMDLLISENNCRSDTMKLKKLINENIKDIPPINLTEGGVFKEGVNKKLDYLRNIKSEKHKEILKMQQKYCLSTGISNLKIKFNNIHGYFIEVTNKNSEKIISFKDIRFSLIQNTINNSRFQTDELKKASNDIQNAQEESVTLEKKLYSDICDRVGTSSPNIHNVSEKISFIDVITNFANLALTRNYSKPNLVEDIVIEIKKGRHPVVEESLLKNSQEFTPNDCCMTKDNFAWLMTGPNMAGKSTFLRQTAIIIILNQIGSFVPAENAKLGIFDKIFTRIGASDNLTKGMSTFMTEMVETSRIINEASKKSLVILDELGRGTSTEDGLAIAQAVLEYIISEVHCMTLFATHYKQLCSLSEQYNVLKLKTLEIKKWNDEIIFLYKVIDGISEGSFGIHVANMAGIKTQIVKRSKTILENINAKHSFKSSVVEKNKFKMHENENSEKLKSIKNILKKVDLDEISPKEALDILYLMKRNF